MTRIVSGEAAPLEATDKAMRPQTLAEFVGQSQIKANLKLPLPELLSEGSTGIAVIVQQERNGLPGPILGAATYER